MKENYIFGYGSLVNSNSRKKTLKKNTDSIPCILKKNNNFRRKWIFRCNKNNSTALGIEKCNLIEANEINGVIFKVNDKDLNLLDKREEGYERVLLDLDKIIFCNKKIDNINIWVYIINTPNLPNKNFPIESKYLNTCINGFYEFGYEYVCKFIKNTYWD